MIDFNRELADTIASEFYKIICQIEQCKKRYELHGLVHQAKIVIKVGCECNQFSQKICDEMYELIVTKFDEAYERTRKQSNTTNAEE